MVAFAITHTETDINAAASIIQLALNEFCLAESSRPAQVCRGLCSGVCVFALVLEFVLCVSLATIAECASNLRALATLEQQLKAKHSLVYPGMGVVFALGAFTVVRKGLPVPPRRR
jgi:hypothetical protein